MQILANHVSWCWRHAVAGILLALWLQKFIGRGLLAAFIRCLQPKTFMR